MKPLFKLSLIASVALIALIVLATYPYDTHLQAYPFLSGADTAGSVSSVDTLEWQVRNDDLNWPRTWNQESTVVAAADKSGEYAVNYQLALNTAWGWADEIRFRILTGSGDTLTSGGIYIGNRAGALLLSLQPDTLTTADTTVWKVRLKGQ